MATGVTGGGVKGSKTAGSSSTLEKSRIMLLTQMYSNLGLSLVSNIWWVDKNAVLRHMAKIIHESNEAIVQTLLY